MSDLYKYKGTWGGRTSSGEEIWWTEPEVKLSKQNRLARFFYYIDVRQHFLIRFFKHSLWQIKKTRPQIDFIKCIDFGCGTGGSTINFSNYVRQPLTGYDIFETQIKIAKEFALNGGNVCQFGLLDKNGQIPLPDGDVQIIYSADVLGHVPDIQKTLKDWFRVLSPGGSIVLFTESDFSLNDRSWSALLAREGLDMGRATAEHISLFPREKLEQWFKEVGFRINERYSANVFHFLFFPNDYWQILKGSKKHRGIYFMAKVWDRLLKLMPFYPKSTNFFRLLLTLAFGSRAYGSGYFYRLTKD